MHRIIWALVLLLSNMAQGQDRCQVIHHPAQTVEGFENWIENRIQDQKIKSLAQGNQQAEEILTIPVVVHVVHNGENIGEGSNLSDAQIMSQIEVLNQDFRRLNADTTDTPEEFRTVASDPRIEFVLAKQDPEGLGTTGITRTLGTRSSWRISNHPELASLSFWPPESYFNIWVAPLTPPVLGYAQFPISDQEGLEDQANVNPNLDGVTIGYRYFGSEGLGNFAGLRSPYDLGRTTTHEIGHFLGLRHVWGDQQGDAGCTVDDFVDDTPLSNQTYLGCASHPQSTCGSVDMTSNYLYFTDDACMNIFTSGQTERMLAVLNSSPRRASLVNSIGTQEPVMVANNLGIRQILAPRAGECNQLISPAVEVRNYGTNTIQSFQIALTVDGNLREELLLEQAIEPLQLLVVEFGSFELDNNGVHNLRYEITETNGGQDGFASNTVATVLLESARKGLLTHLIRFETDPQDWIVRNPDAGITWQTVDAPGNGIDNRALALNFYNYALNSVGEKDYFISPVLDFSGVVSAELSFKVAYARSSKSYDEGLIVGISRDCGNSVAAEDIPYQKFGNNLATRSSIPTEFIPDSESEWRTEVVNLTEFKEIPELQIMFIGQNGFGNNLFIDDILIRIEREFNLETLSPVPISCESIVEPQVRMVNPRLETIQTAMAQIVIPGQIDETLQFDNLNTPPGQAVVLAFPQYLLEAGNYEFQVTILSIDGDTSDIQGRNQDTVQFLIDQTVERIPLRENFEESFDSWNVLEGPLKWEKTHTAMGSNSALVVANYANPVPNSSSVLASAIIDMSGILEASMFFRVSHANFPGISDTLQVFASLDCGATFSELLFQKSDSVLAVTSSDQYWTPESESHWRKEFIDLSNLAGFSEVRFAFLATNSGGNNIYLDDIEFFLSSNADPVEVESNQYLIFPNPAPKIFNLAFNLKEKQDLSLKIVDTQGHFVLESDLPGILNQTKTIDLSAYSHGIYFIRVTGKTFSKTERVSLSY